MSVDIKLLDKDTFEEKMDNLILAVHGVSSTGGGEVSVTTWKQVQSLVRAGLAPKVFSIGDKFICPKETAISATCSNSSVHVSVDATTFLAKLNEAGTKDYEATYDGIEWHDEEGNNLVLSTYGITISGTPVLNDKIVVHETANNIEFIVMGFDQETPVDTSRTHSMTLAMKYTFTGVVFSDSQAGYYFKNGLSAGSYAIPVGNYDTTYGGNKTYYFTITNAIPAGGQIRVDWAYNTQFVARNLYVYASSSATVASETVALTESEISGAIALPTLANSNIVTTTITDAGGNSVEVKANNVARMRYGNNNWTESAIRQWCNSDKIKGNVWSPQTVFDRQPSWATTLDGFLYGLDGELVSVLGECVKDTELNTVCDGGGHTTTNDKVWLLSRYEIQSCSLAEANTYPPYTWWHNLLGDTYGDWRTDTRFIKTNTSGSAQYWWLRSPYTGIGSNARFVHTSGNVTNNHAYIGGQASVVFAII